MDFANIFNINLNNLLVPIAVSCVLVFLYQFLTSSFSYWKDRNVPYIEPLPLFGNMKDQVLSKKPLVLIFKDIYDSLQSHRFGGLFQLKEPTLLIRDPNLAELILVKDFKHFYDRGFTVNVEGEPLMGNLFLLNGKTWRDLRYKLTPTFTTGKLKGMFDQINRSGGHLVSFVERESNLDRPIEASTILTGFTLDVIASCAFGLQLDKDDKLSIDFRKMFDTILKPSRAGQIKHVIRHAWPKLAKRLGLRGISRDMESMVINIVKETLKFREKNNINRNDFLQLMLNIQREEKSGQKKTSSEEMSPDDDVINQMNHLSPEESRALPHEQQKTLMSDEVIAAQAFVFLIAGAETVSSTVSFALLCLSQNPKIQERVQREIDSSLQQYGGQWTYQAVRDMTYLEQVIQETLRLYPITGQLFRICTQPYKIPDSDYIVEKGVRLVIPVYAIQNDPLNYASPEVFDPDRFVDNNFRPSGRYMPFGDGPRICIGMRFAILEVQLVLARLLSEFTVKLNSKTQLPINFHSTSSTLAVQGGVWLDFEKRTQT